MKALVIGANYGLAGAAALLERGFSVDVFCTSAEAFVLNSDGFSINYGKNQRKSFYPGKNLRSISVPNEKPYDVCILAVQEPSINHENILSFLTFLMDSKIPIISFMNIPLLPFINRIIRLSPRDAHYIYVTAQQQQNFCPELIINSSPEPQVFAASNFNNIYLRLGGNFRCSEFVTMSRATAERLRSNENCDIPLYFKDYENLHVSLSKLPMLLAGNYRCFSKSGLQSIKEAVNENIELSAVIYEEVVSVLKSHGGQRRTIIPFRSYLKASRNLDAPSSVAKAIKSGRHEIERSDRLVQRLGSASGVPTPHVDAIVARIDDELTKNQSGS